jgi:hypothetical protein
MRVFGGQIPEGMSREAATKQVSDCLAEFGFRYGWLHCGSFRLGCHGVWLFPIIGFQSSLTD